MDQPTLGCKLPIIHTPDTKPDGSRPLLRRVSHSDPHLDIPHFISVQDRGFHGFPTNLSGLFEHSKPFNQLGSRDNMPHQSGEESGLKLGAPKSPGLDRNKSAFELSTTTGPTAETGGLRKASSVANYRNIHPEGGFGSGFFSSALHLVTGHSPSLQQVPEDEGLTMNVRSDPTFSAGLSATDAAHSLSPNTETNTSPTGTLDRVKSSMLGIVRSGFLGKPVMCNPEENYRYIMALDR